MCSFGRHSPTQVTRPAATSFKAKSFSKNERVVQCWFSPVNTSSRRHTPHLTQNEPWLTQGHCSFSPPPKAEEFPLLLPIAGHIYSRIKGNFSRLKDSKSHDVYVLQLCGRRNRPLPESSQQRRAPALLPGWCRSQWSHIHRMTPTLVTTFTYK